MTIGRRNPVRIIGAFAPSSGPLAEAMTRFVNHDKQRILEVGAGTGAITKAIIKKMSPHHRADVVELIPQLATLLQKRFGHCDKVVISCSDILTYESKEGSYDLIISSLPFNAFSPDMTKAVIDRLVSLAQAGAILSFFEYRILHGIARFVLPKKRFTDFCQSRSLIEKFIDRFKFDEEVVNMNMPPAVVHYLRINKSK